MKPLALHVLLSLLTFSVGVGIERMWTKESPAHTQAIQCQPASPYLFTTPLLPSVETPVPVNLGTQTKNLIFDYKHERFDPYGEYLPIGGRPKGIREFEGIMLPFYPQSDGTVAGDITLLIYSNEMHDTRTAVIGLVTEHRLYFVTGIVSDDEIEYRFDGEFLRGKIVGDAPAGQAVLKGTLTKYKKGRKIAEAVVKFRIEAHYC